MRSRKYIFPKEVGGVELDCEYGMKQLTAMLPYFARHVLEVYLSECAVSSAYVV